MVGCANRARQAAHARVNVHATHSIHRLTGHATHAPHLKTVAAARFAAWFLAARARFVAPPAHAALTQGRVDGAGSEAGRGSEGSHVGWDRTLACVA